MFARARYLSVLSLLFVPLGNNSLARADAIAISSSADTGIFQLVPGNNFGGATFFNAGTAGNFNVNRGLIMFDLTGVVPAGSIITGGTLTIDIVRAPASGQVDSNFALHRLLQSWGEGIQVPSSPDTSPGTGSPAEDGEATWVHRFASDLAWSEPGGVVGVDFLGSVSSIAFIGDLGEQGIFATSDNLVADLQRWLDHPEENFGWLLKTEEENEAKTARSFASRESGFGPTLTIEFVPVPEPGTITLAVLGLVVMARRMIRYRS